MERNICFEIRALNNLLTREMTQVLEQAHSNNTAIHGMIIDFLLKNQDKSIFQKDLEEKFSMRRSTASRMLSLMEGNGMIERITVSEDARLKKIVLTSKGASEREAMNEKRRKIEEKLKKNISEGELDIFFQVVEKLKRNLE